MPAAVNAMAMSGRIIEWVKRYPLLYDPKHLDYKDMRKRDELWTEIGKDLKQDGDEVKKKWRNIKDCYLKHLRALNPIPGQNKRTYKNWQWARQMEFLKSTIDLNFAESESSEENTTEKSSKRRIPQIKDTVSHVDYVATPQPSKQTVGDTDATDLIFLGYSNTIKKFGPKRQAIVKMRIAQIIMEEELNNLEESSTDFRNSSPVSEDAGCNESQPCSSTSNFNFSMKIEESDPY